MYTLDERSSPEFYVEELLTRFLQREGAAAREDLQAFAERYAGGQLEDALIELLGLPPDDAVRALLEWQARMEKDGVPRPLSRRRVETIRRLAALSEREFMDAGLEAFLVERHGGTLSQLLDRAMRSDAPS